MIQIALNNKNAICQYITLTRKNAEQICWNDCLNFLDEQNIKYVKNSTKLCITLENNSQIRFNGCPDKSSVATYKGSRYSICIIDETQDFSAHLKNLIDDAIEPALRDLNGELILIGTPNPLRHGVFYEAYHGTGQFSGFSAHHWTMWDNPYLEKQSGISTDAYVEDLLHKRGWTYDHPTFRREFLGEWILDLDSLVYKISEERNQIHTSLRGNSESCDYFIGVDFGYNDADAICVIGCSQYDRTIYLVEEWKAETQSITPVAIKLQEFYEKYKPISIVCDTGGLGKKIVEDIIERFGLPLIAAEKQQKLGYIEIFNADIIAGHFKAKIDSYWWAEASNLTWDLTKEKPCEQSSAENHMCDAVLYSFREMRKYYTINEPKILTDEEKMMRIIDENNKKSKMPQIGGSSYARTLEPPGQTFDQVAGTKWS